MAWSNYRYKRRSYGRRRRYGGNGGGPRTVVKYVKARPFAWYKKKPKRSSSSQKRGRFKHVDLSGGGAATKFLMGQIDPFDSNVKGAKVPDSNTMMSDTINVNDTFTVGVTTGGNVRCYAFNVWPRGAVVQSTEGGLGWTWTAAYGGTFDLTRLPDITSSYTGIRCVSQGVRLSATLAPTTATGFVHIGVYAASTYGEASWPFPTGIAGLVDLPWYRKVTLASLTQSPITIVNKFLDQTAFRYEDPDQAAGGFVNTNRGEFHIPHSWATILVAFEGTPSGSLVSVETVHHFEALPLHSTLTTATPAASANPTVMNAAGNVSARVPATHFESEQAGMMSQAAAAVSEGMQTGLSNLASALGEAALNAGANYVQGMIAPNTPGLPGVNNQNRLMLTN